MVKISNKAYLFAVVAVLVFQASASAEDVSNTSNAVGGASSATGCKRSIPGPGFNENLLKGPEGASTTRTEVKAAVEANSPEKEAVANGSVGVGQPPANLQTTTNQQPSGSGTAGGVKLFTDLEPRPNNLLREKAGPTIAEPKPQVGTIVQQRGNMKQTIHPGANVVDMPPN